MKRLILTVGLGIALIGANAQTASPELVSSAGDSFNNTSYQLDWSVGECLTATHSSGSYVLTQGLHQSSYNITAVEDLRSEIEMTVSPNPTSDLVSLKVESLQVESMQYTITDLSGKVLANGEILSTLQTLNFTNYSAGTYLISVSQNNQLIKSFQIIKK